MRKYKNDVKEPEELTFWQSYSDMMAALLLVFVLIIAFAITLTKSTYEEKEAELEKLEAQYEENQEKLREQTKRLQEQQIEIDEQRVAFEQQQEKLDAIVGIRTTIIKNLKEEFDNTDFNIVVDSETGAITFDSSILFDVDSSVLKQAGRNFLNEFFPMYFETLLSEGIKDYVAEVIIEGHTDDVGTYLYNLDLSQKRASAVVKYCLAENGSMFDKEQLERIRSLVTANGRSFIDVIRTENGEVDRQASRRVEIKFRLREDEMIQEMIDILDN